MANTLSVQMAEGYRAYPIDDHGKLRFQYGSVAALAVALPIADTIELFKLPPGRIRVLPCLSRVSTTAWGASRTLAIGHRAYSKRPSDVDSSTDEAENASAFVAALDVSGALASAVLSTVMKYDIYARQEVNVFATIAGGTMPVAATLQVLLAYLYE